VALALKEDPEADQRIDLEGAVPIDPPIAASSGDDDLDEACLPEQALAEPLEAGRRQGKQNAEQLLAVALGLGFTRRRGGGAGADVSFCFSRSSRKTLTHLRNSCRASAGVRWVCRPRLVRLQTPRLDRSRRPSRAR
jgi:hypothetical protein